MNTTQFTIKAPTSKVGEKKDCSTFTPPPPPQGNLIEATLMELVVALDYLGDGKGKTAVLNEVGKRLAEKYTSITAPGPATVLRYVNTNLEMHQDPSGLLHRESVKTGNMPTGEHEETVLEKRVHLLEYHLSIQEHNKKTAAEKEKANKEKDEMQERERGLFSGAFSDYQQQVGAGSCGLVRGSQCGFDRAPPVAFPLRSSAAKFPNTPAMRRRSAIPRSRVAADPARVAVRNALPRRPRCPRATSRS